VTDKAFELQNNATTIPKSLLSLTGLTTEVIPKNGLAKQALCVCVCMCATVTYGV